jgi:uncharacterized protein (TIGR03437 family)
MRFDGAQSSAVLEPLQLLKGKSNYFIGDPSEWRRDIPQYGRMRYRGVYPGVDLVFYGSERRLEYDWVLAPGADPKAIRMCFEGAKGIAIDSSGDLTISAGNEQFRQMAPRIVQDGRRVDGRFVKLGKNTVGFEIAAYDPSQPLTIDPVLSYSTFLGGQDADAIYALAIDSEGNLIVGGATLSPNFPSRNAIFGPATGDVQGFIAKVNPRAAGGESLLWSTYLGATGKFTYVLGATVDPQGNVIVTGTTAAPNFPLVNPYQKFLNKDGNTNSCPNSVFDINQTQSCSDAFLFKLNSAGNQIAFSTFLGGTGNDVAYAIGTDAASNIFVTGQTSSGDFPAPGSPFQTTLKGASDVFVSKFNPTGSLTYSTYLGGEAEEVAMGMAISPQGSVYLGGTTSSVSFPLVSPLQNVKPAPVVGFVARLDFSASGQVILGYSTYLGSVGGSSSIAGLALDSKNNVYVAGGTSAPNFPTTANAVQSKYSYLLNSSTPPFSLPAFLVPTFSAQTVNGDAFVTELNTNAVSTAQLVYSTLLGGIYNDAATGVVLDAQGRIVVIGTTDSYDFPVTPDAFVASNGSASVSPTLKAFLTVIDPTKPGLAAVAYSTFLGGSGNDIATRIVADTNAVDLVGQTKSRNFPTQSPFQPVYGGQFTSTLLDGDGFISRFDFTQNSPIINSATNGASFQLGAGYAPGEIVTFKGSRIGPQQILLAQLAPDGRLATQLGDCQVLVDGAAAPLVHSLSTQITAILPYELAAKIGQTVNTQVDCAGLASNVIPLPIVDADPGVFSVGGGTGPAALLNQDGSYNSSGNPALRGTLVQIFGTGEGVLTPSGVDGRIETGPLQTIPKPTLPIRVFFGGVGSLDVPYVGVAPGLVDGLLQINARIPPDAPTGDIELVLQVGTRMSPKKLTISVK